MGCEEPFVFVLRISSNKDWGPPEERRVWCEEPFVFVYLNILPASNIISLYHRAGWSKNLSKSMHLMARGATRPGPARVVVRPRAWWRHVPSGAFDHRLFFGGFFSTGIPTSSYFLAASNGGLEVRRPDLAGKFARTGAERLGGLI